MGAGQDSTRRARLGGRPGALEIPAGSPPPRIRLMEYDATGIDERDIRDVEALIPYARTARTTWVDIQGLGDEPMLRRVAEIFGIHPLALADAVNSPQRAKVDRYDDYLLVIARAPDTGFDAWSQVPQVCLIVSELYVISFQERYFGFFEGVRDRIRTGGGFIRSSGPGYLAYALVDALVDHYYPVVEQIADELDEIEEGVLETPDPESVARLHRIQRRITTLRRVIRPQVEALYQMSHGDPRFIPEPTRPFVRDVHDHARQIEGRLDAAREIAVDTMGAVLATLGHRQNEIMKVLTLVGSIFIPLTFLAGIYGMNFENMPELRSPRGYFIVLGVMVILAIGMVFFFRRKGWIGTRRRD